MQFIDLHAQQIKIQSQIQDNINKVLEHGKYIMGPEVISLEKRLSDFLGVRHAIGCSSGTDALLLALLSFDVGPKSAIFTTPFTFFATAEVIALLKGVPVFVDISKNNFNMDIDLLEKAITALKKKDRDLYPLPAAPVIEQVEGKGIIAVDLFGLPCNYDKIKKLAEKHDLFIVQDAAQSFGSMQKGRHIGSLSDISCTSFFPAKPLGCYGDGGMCFTNSDSKADILRSFRVHGKGKDKYQNARIGLNARLDTLQAAVLHAKFDIFAKECSLRSKVASNYTKLFNYFIDNSPSSKKIIPPEPEKDYQSAWAQYTILAEDEIHRKEIQSHLTAQGIPTVIYYPTPLHLQECLSYLGYRTNDFKVCENFSKRVISLPMHPYLSESDQEKIVKTSLFL